MGTGKLIGIDDGTIDGNAGGNYFCLQKFIAVATGNCIEVRLKTSASGNVKVAVYAADGGSGNPGTRLASLDTSTAVVTGWNILMLEAPCSLVSGTAYWLAVNVSADEIMGYDNDDSAGYAFKAYTFLNFAFPDPCPDIDGSGWARSTLVTFYLAGWGIPVLSPSSISQPMGYGLPGLNLKINPLNTVQAVACGVPTVSTYKIVIAVQGISLILSCGTLSLRYLQDILPQSIIQSVSSGTPWIGIFGFIRPQSIVQQISISSPAILKYVWHVILDGQYSTETPAVNRAYVIGRDQCGNPVYGTAIDSAELDLVGERLDFQQELAIPTSSQVASMASAVLSKMRLTRSMGIIFMPPNCGQELFDVVQISDSSANQSNVKFRVIGIRFQYYPRDARYQHKLILGVP